MGRKKFNMDPKKVRPRVNKVVAVENVIWLSLVDDI